LLTAFWRSCSICGSMVAFAVVEIGSEVSGIRWRLLSAAGAKTPEAAVDCERTGIPALDGLRPDPLPDFEDEEDPVGEASLGIVLSLSGERFWPGRMRETRYTRPRSVSTSIPPVVWNTTVSSGSVRQLLPAESVSRWIRIVRDGAVQRSPIPSADLKARRWGVSFK